MEINVKDLYRHKGRIVFICDYRLNDKDPIHNKPARDVKPQKVIVSSNEVLPKNKTVYYSDFHFKKTNKKGSAIKSSVIAPFDYSGSRHWTGVPLKIFDNFEECVECWNNQLQIAIEAYNKYKEEIIDIKINDLINKEVKYERC